MADKSFLSGRIPNELYKKVEEYAAKTGLSKTEIMIKGVATLLNFELPEPSTSNTDNQKISTLEQEVTNLKGAVKSLWEEVKILKEAKDKHQFKENSNLAEEGITDKAVNSNVIKIDNTDNAVCDLNSENTKEGITTEINGLSRSNTSFKKIEIEKVIECTGLTRNTINASLRKIPKNIKEEKRILKNPVQMKINQTITIDGQNYQLLYAGKNQLNKNLFSLVLSETITESLFELPSE